MKPLSLLRIHLATGEFEFTQHALERTVERNIADAEIREAGGKAFLIEDYPDDKYAPTCLSLGFTAEGRPLHIQVTRSASRFRLKIITLYEPNSAEWTDFAERSH